MANGPEQNGANGAGNQSGNTEGVGLGTQSANGGNGAPLANNGSGGNGGGATANWYAGLDTDNQAYIKTKGWDKPDKSPADVIKSYRELETAFGQRSSPNVPKTPSEYNFTKPTKLPDSVAYSAEMVGKFAQTAHKMGVSQEAASALHDFWLDAVSKGVDGAGESYAEQIVEDVRGAQTSLREAWGPEDSPAFKRNVELADRAVRLLDPGLRDALKEVGVIRTVDGRDVVANATIVKALAKVGNMSYAEDALHATPATDSNPFERGAKENVAMQGRLVTSDPEKAALLIRAAGREADFKSFFNRTGL